MSLTYINTGSDSGLNFDFNKDLTNNDLVTVKISDLTIRSASLVLDECETEVDAVSTGVPQSSLIYPLLFLIYTVPLYGIMEAEGLHVIGFVYDIIIYTEVDIVENACRLSRAWKNVCEWAKIDAHSDGSQWQPRVHLL